MKTLLLLIVVVLLAGCGDGSSTSSGQNKVISCIPGELVKDQNGNQGICSNSGYIILSVN